MGDGGQKYVLLPKHEEAFNPPAVGRGYCRVGDCCYSVLYRAKASVNDVYTLHREGTDSGIVQQELGILR